MADILKKKMQSRRGHRLYVKKLLPEAVMCIQAGTPEAKTRALEVRASLSEQLESLTALDQQILDLLEAEEEMEDETLLKEIEESGELRSKIKARVTEIDELVKPVAEPPASPVITATIPSTTDESFIGPMQKSVKVKLPKLRPKRFSGKVQEWQEFWDSFESSIHNNETLSDVDKFCYLRSLLIEPASSAIAGFALTTANYEAAVNVLKNRFGKKSAVQRAHINELLKVAPVYNDKDTARLRALYDSVETHHRALGALKVDEGSYAYVVVPSVLEKLPEALRLTITRGQDHLQWQMSDLLAALEKEIELREECQLSRSNQQQKRRNPDLTSASALLISKNKNCAFCMGAHPHENCTKIVDVKKRKQIVSKFGRCFNCLQKGHRIKDCTATVICKSCNGKHHSAMCEVPQETSQGEGVSPSKEVSSQCVHSSVGGTSRVALQTAQALVKGKGNRRVRALFDSASHKSFITSSVVKALGLQTIRSEWLAVSTFGQRAKKSQQRNVVQLELMSVQGGKAVRVEAFVVPEISSIQNESLEVAKHEYPHLEGLWLSDVCRSKERLEIDILVGADYLWSFQTGRVVRGEPDQPVAIETEIGWVLSGPLCNGAVETGGEQESQVNFVGQDMSQENRLDREVRKLWELETLGIRERDEVYEEFQDSITFNGTRYSVKLPWKAGHPELPDNYKLSLSRLNSQIRKLRKEDNLLQEYDAVIQDQLQRGIIEKVVKLEKAEKEHYIPHLAVIRKEAETTKLRVVYDASAKEGPRVEPKGKLSKAGTKGVSLNDCLHVGPALNPLLFDILVRFREKSVVVCADIEKAFLNIEVDKSDRDCLRFLWLENFRDVNARVLAYRFKRLVFGVCSSPFLLNATLRYHLSQFVEEDPEFVSKLKDDFFVDDLVTGEYNTDSAYVLYEKARRRLASGGFNLRKWKTNDSILRDKIGKQEKGECDGVTSIRSDEQSYAKLTLGTEVSASCQKVLGLPWDCERDIIQFNFSTLVGKATGKRPT